MHNQWGGSLEIQDKSREEEEDERKRQSEFDRGALTWREELDETRQGWLLEKEDVSMKKKDKYIDFGCIVCKRKLFKWIVGVIVIAFLVIGLPIIISKFLPKPKEAPPPPDKYSIALHKALMFFDLQKSGRLPKKNNVSWRGDSGLMDGADLSDVKGGLVGGYYDSGCNIKYHFPMAFSMTLLSWSVIEYKDKYIALGEYDHVRDIIKWGTDYLLLTFNNSASKIDHIYSQVGVATNASTGPNPDDNYCWTRPEDMDYPRPVLNMHSGPDLAGEMASAFAAASIVFRDNVTYSYKLLNSSINVYNFARDKGKRQSYSRDISQAYPFYNSTGYFDEFMWGATWLYLATGNNSYLSLSTHPSFGKNAKALSGGIKNKVFGWDNKLPGAELVLSRIRLFLNPGFPYEDMLSAYYNITGLNMCSYLNNFQVFNYTRGGLIQLQLGRPKPLQYAVNAAYLASLYSDYMGANQIPGFYCGDNFFSRDVLKKFSTSQVDYILGKNPMNMSYVVGYGSKYPTHVHHRGASIPNNNVNYSCEGGQKWLEIETPNPNTIIGAMVSGPDHMDRFHDKRTNPNYTEPTLAGNAGLVVALISLTSTGGEGNIDKNGIFEAIPPLYPRAPPPPTPWQP